MLLHFSSVASLGANADPRHLSDLIAALRTKTLAEVAALPSVATAAKDFYRRVTLGLNYFKARAALEDDGIVVFDVNTQAGAISRYAPYYVYPHARYSAGITRFDSSARITAMRNPWLHFQSVPLGKILERFGGGGHERVAGLVVSEERVAEARSILAQIVDVIRTEDQVIDRGRKTA